MNRRALAPLWTGLVFRCLVLVWWAIVPFGARAASDLSLYAQYATGGLDGLLDGWFPWEYPPLSRAVLIAVPAGNPQDYMLRFAALLFVVDIAVLFWLGRRVTVGRPTTPVWLWAVAIPLLSTVPYSRMDLLVGVCAAGSFILAKRRPLWAGVCLSIAIGLKLWPIVLAPCLVAFVPKHKRLPTLAVIVGPWMAFEAIGVWAWGTDSLVAPVEWMVDRGIQIESLAATIPLATSLGSGSSAVWGANSWEVSGWSWLGSVITILGLAAVGFILARSTLILLRRRTEARYDLLCAAGVSASACLIASSKVLSPQYLIWLIALVAVLGTMTSISIQRVSWLLVVVSALTTIVYPLSYSGLLEGELAPYLWLVGRNVLLVLVAIQLTISWWKLSIEVADPAETLRMSRSTT